MALDFSSILLWIILMGLAAYVLRDFLAKGGKISSPIGSLEGPANGGDGMEDRITRIEKDLRETRTRLAFLESKDELKREFRNKLAKLVRRVEHALTERSMSEMARVSGLDTQIIKSMDEWHSLYHLIDDMGNAMTKQGMDDFDRNGFEYIGLRPDGTVDQRTCQAYADEKHRDYHTSVVAVVDSLLERPMTAIPIRDENGSIVRVQVEDRHIYLTQTVMEGIAQQVIEEHKDEIADLYTYVIDRYRAIKEVGSDE